MNAASTFAIKPFDTGGTVRPLFASELRKKRFYPIPNYSSWCWHVDEVFVKINGKTRYLWRAVDHEGEMLEAYVSKKRNKLEALTFLKKAMKRYRKPVAIGTDKPKSYQAALKEPRAIFKQGTGR